MTLVIVIVSVLIIYLSIRVPLFSKGRVSDTLLISAGNKVFQIIFPSLLLSLVFGLRDRVGVDYPIYKEIFENDIYESLSHTLRTSPVEWLFTSICWIIKWLNLPFYCMFIVMGFIPMIFYMAFIRNFPKQCLLCTYFLFACGVIFWYFNIMRQGVAFFILLYSCKFIISKDFCKYLLFVIIAAGFHSSSYIFIIFYIFSKKENIISSRIALVIYILTWVLSSLFLDTFFERFNSALLVGTGYAKYINNISTWTMGGGLGLGVLSLHLVDISIIAISKIIYSKSKSYRIDLFYKIYFIGTCISNLAGNNMILSRIPFCMVSMRFFIAGYLCSYIQKNWEVLSYLDRICGLSIILFSSAYLLGNIIYTQYAFILP